MLDQPMGICFLMSLGFSQYAETWFRQVADVDALFVRAADLPQARFGGANSWASGEMPDIISQVDLISFTLPEQTSGP